MTVVNPKSISGINSITMASGSDNLLTIHTTNTTERVRVNSSGDVIVGSGITVSPDGDIFATGVTTSTTFVGALTGNVTGTLQTAAQANVTSLGTLTGLTVNGDASFTGASYNMTWDKSDNSLIVNDNARVKFGTGKDLHIYHNESNSVIREEGTGNLNLQTTGGNVEILVNTTETAAKFISDGAVELYHNNSKKLDTDSEGISVTGTVKINNTSSVGDYNGGADDMLIGTHSGNHGLTILSGTSNGGFIMFSDNNGGGTNAYRGQIEYAHSSDYMRFITDSGERVRILSGGGITFNGDTATANALDDYEEGTFSATITSGGTVSSFTHNKCSYIKIGRQVHFQIYLQFTGSGNGSLFKIGNLPFTSSNYSTYGFGGASIVYQNNAFQAADVGGHVANSGTVINFYKGDGNIMAGNGGNLFGNADFILIGQYQAG